MAAGCNHNDFDCWCIKLSEEDILEIRKEEEEKKAKKEKRFKDPRVHTFRFNKNFEFYCWCKTPEDHSKGHVMLTEEEEDVEYTCWCPSYPEIDASHYATPSHHVYVKVPRKIVLLDPLIKS